MSIGMNKIGKGARAYITPCPLAAEILRVRRRRGALPRETLQEPTLSVFLQITVANIINKLLFGYSYPHNKSERLLTYANAINSIFTDMFKSLFFVVVQLFPFMRKFPYIGYQAVGQHADKYLWVSGI